MKPSGSLSLFQLPTSHLHPQHVLEGREDEHVHPYSYVLITEQGIRGSCACYHDREDVTDQVVDEDLQLKQVQERYPTSVNLCYGYGVCSA